MHTEKRKTRKKRTYCGDNEHFTKIALRQKWSRDEAAAGRWSTTLTNDHPLYKPITREYYRMEIREALTNRKLEFFNSVSYVVRDDPESVRVRVNVGDVVDVREDREGTAYARVVAIIRHKLTEERHYAFFLFEWFAALTHSEAVLDCPVYELQRELQRPDTWHPIFSLSVVDHTPRVHFVHACRRGECTH